MNTSADMGDGRPERTRPHHQLTDSSLPPASCLSCNRLVIDCMEVHQTQAAFLKALIAYEDSEASRQLQDNLVKADRENRFVRHAMFVVLILMLLSLSAIGYCAILQPRVFFDSEHLVIKSLSILGLASSICLLELTGYLLWQHFEAGRLHKECRRWAMFLVERHIKESMPRDTAVDNRQGLGSPPARAPIRQTREPLPPSLEQDVRA